MNVAPARLRLAIVDDYAIVVAGVSAFLASERIDVVETGASTPVVSDVDIVLYDTFGQVQGEGIDLQDFVRDARARVVIYSWNLNPQLIEQALPRGRAATSRRCSPDHRSSTPSTGSCGARSSSASVTWSRAPATRVTGPDGRSA